MQAFRLFADLSSNNPGFNAEAYRKAGHRVVAIKATEGITYRNPDWLRWTTEAHAARLSVLHYAFLRPELRLSGEGDFLMNTTRDHMRKGDQLVLDFEREVQDAANLGRYLQRVWDECSAQGHHPILYGPESLLRAVKPYVGRKVFSRVWVAAWGPLIRGFWAQQFTNGSVGPEPHGLTGVQGNCDVSRLNLSTAIRFRFFTR